SGYGYGIFLAGIAAPFWVEISFQCCGKRVWRGGEMRLILIGAAVVCLTSCASRSSDISAAYVSPAGFQSYNCVQLGREAQNVAARAAQVSGVQDEKRTRDTVATGVALLVFWPAAFLVGGDGASAAELAQLKGQMVAIEQASNQKRCNIR